MTFATDGRRRRARTLRLALMSGAALLAAGATGAAEAQVAPTPAAQPPAAGGAAAATQVPEVIVTAEKRSEDIQRVPASVTALDTRHFDAQGFVRFEDYLSTVPGVSFIASNGREGSTQITIRGVTTGVAQSAAATSIYVDEAPVGSVNAYAAGTLLTPDLDPTELSQIEVLKGPQGTLYGAGAMGGLVKFVTLPLNYGAYGARVSTGGDAVEGGGDGFALRGLVNVPLGDDLALRVSGFEREDPGFIDNVTGKKNSNDTRLYGGHVELGWRPNDHFSIVLSALAQATQDQGEAVEFVNGATLKPTYGDLKLQSYIPQPEHESMEVYNATIRNSWGGFDLVSSTTFETIRAFGVGDGTPSYGQFLGAVFGIPDFGIKETLSDSTNRWVQELRLGSKAFGGRLEYQVGVYYSSENDGLAIPGFYPFDTATLQPIPFPNIVSAEILTRYAETAGFANATVHLTDQLSLLAGVRYAVDDQTYFQDYAGLLVGPEIRTRATSTDDVPTWLVSPSYQITDNSMVYLRAASGYRPGGPNALPPAILNAPSTFAPDSLVSYEAGYKAEFLDRRITLDAAAFYTDWKDIQIQTSAAGFNYYVNGGAAHIDGGEISLVAAPAEGLTLGANGAYTNARLASPAAAAGGRTGDELPFVPLWTGSVSANYRRPLTGEWTADGGGSVTYTGQRISDFSGRYGLPVPAYTTLNLNAGVDNRGWRLSVYATNLTNVRGITYLKSLGLTPSSEPFAAGIIQPLTVGMELSSRF